MTRTNELAYRQEVTPHRRTGRFFPFLTWLRGYRTSDFRSDLVAGLTVAVVLIPQSMAYAMLAGMPPVYGLYAAAATPWIAALWGSLRQLSTGPIAVMSLLVLTTLSPFAEPGTPQFIELALLLSFMVGVFYLAIGVFRLGVIMSFISHSAVKGFTSAAALIITATQLPHFLGLSVPKREYILPMILDLIRGLPDVHLPTLAVGLLAFAVIYGLRKYRSNLPAALIALLVTTVPLVLLELPQSGIAVVGESPRGLPGFHIPSVDFRTISTLIGPALVLALVCFAETYSVGKAISAETKQKVDVDQEFIGQGLANLAGSFLQAYPVGGSFSRTAINYSAGARTGISSVVAGFSAALALLFLTPLFTYIPRAALAAIVISAVLLLFHPREVLSLWRMNRHDGIVALTVFLLALATKPDYALLIGVVASLIFFMWKTMHPRVVRVTKDPELNMFLNGDVHGKPSCPQILELRSDNSIFFGNAEYTVEQMLSRLRGQQTPVKFLLLDFEAIGFVDVSAVDELRTLLDELRRQGTTLALIYVHQPVRTVLESTGFLKEMGQDTILGTRGVAISFLFQRLDHTYCRDICPHKLFHECFTVK
ncbi:MAG: SulP family inorganic anion transporter [Deltaproteobacteria bacterium]|nr:SulP family inorganic anion transporter [Deltaproteobacteria bacterium]